MTDMEEAMTDIEEEIQKIQAKEAEELMLARGLRKPPKHRAGITTNKGHGESKARRKMARQSRKMNRN